MSLQLEVLKATCAACVDTGAKAAKGIDPQQK